MKTVTRAGIIAGSYVALATLWILASGRLALALSRTAEELEALERSKGLGFVFFTGAVLFLVAWGALRRQQADADAAARAREALLKSERNAMAGLFVSSIAHDASNLTMIITSALELLRGERQLSADSRESLDDASDAMGKLITLFKDLKQMGSGRDGSAQVPAELGELSRRIVTLLKGHSAMKHCRVTVDAPERVTASVFPVLVDQVLINLLLNAADATGGRGVVEVRLRGDEREVRLEVHDDGKGLSPEVEAHLFTPFATTKPHGTGLGLVSVKECARAHGGHVEYARSPLGGAAFSVVLPRGPGARTRAA